MSGHYPRALLSVVLLTAALSCIDAVVGLTLERLGHRVYDGFGAWALCNVAVLACVLFFLAETTPT